MVISSYNLSTKPINFLDIDKCVAALIDPNSKRLNVSFLEGIFSKNEVEVINRISIAS